MKKVLLLGFLLLAQVVSALDFPFPAQGDDLIGEEKMVVAKETDTLVEMGRRYGLGFDEITGANAAVDTWLPGEGTPVLLPLRFILPDATRRGIVINAAEMRLYYYPSPAKGATPIVESYPISIGRSDWSTPLLSTKVVRKAKNPAWYPPASLRLERAREGDPPWPSVVLPGPDNPLGTRALYLGIGAYLIHGTNEAKANGIGMQVTHGCMRMYPEDIERLFDRVPVGTPVSIVNQHIKLGWDKGVLYIEIHPWLEGTPEAVKHDKLLVPNMVQKALALHPGHVINQNTLEFAEIERNGIPVRLSVDPLETVEQAASVP